MHRVQVELGERSYPITIASGLLQQPNHLCKHYAQVIIISNDTVAPLYLEAARRLFADSQVQHFLLPDGEAFKTLEQFGHIQTFLLENRLARDGLLVALGGGVVGDLTGFVAACYQRGIDFIQIPTTLLSQVDSSVGGKTAVNHPLGKNMIGAFKQPQQVLIDTDVLATLPKKEFAAGMAEVVKYALIADPDFFDYLEQHAEAIEQLEPAVLATMIAHCCQMKADIVAADETEQGKRALLNLGHTFGHAIEAWLGYGHWLHGEAVAVGMMMAAQLAQSRGWLSVSELDRIKSLLIRFSLPVVKPEGMSIQDFMPYMKTDKKVRAGKMRFVLPTSFGYSEIIDDVDEAELLSVFS
ncbi:3-dehydroquinate synthase [Alkalimonas sp. MEB108]|uniref:3-dehydroquinate synthase n=1 Tax=Alkalimonas cellulosilytica TaxID=3058395 RepID=A0ABU7J4R5_9GAMM|nr:3-dehydroquinate synthase [Alkalimonas sp. MEB108]MEE2001027.1 3-dehydroquinate synthase [Alkalimonas sp. MEB108]